MGLIKNKQIRGRKVLDTDSLIKKLIFSPGYTTAIFKNILFFNTETRDYFQVYLNLGIDNNLNWPEFLPVIINSSL